MKKITIGITGASGAIYGIRAVEMLNSAGVETHLVVSEAAGITMALETDYDIETVRKSAHRCHDNRDIGASIASGSFGMDGMVIAPCSMRTLGAVANSLGDNLIVRAADVTLKEGKPLILVVRETPLHRGHLRLLDLVARAGGIIFPPVPALYGRPRTIEEMVDGTVGRFLHRLGVDTPHYHRWQGIA
ncbi:UbiX family flavin prenyltransferase [Desulfopila sp. IMCC35006]|uniref:UbiX family flavin prenyltransferase n=1 Tax=Desulfopila sp. IMCC35006 TaxID=2569542 RepID=UPI0010AD4A3B|nr:UbiX family flavin prenyltransferase [Desulfopila sp. IMCC35006]TKB26526.1 UbiX family flavin prenyltransferase [Desulfopila sp. IMCC35006]